MTATKTEGTVSDYGNYQYGQGQDDQSGQQDQGGVTGEHGGG